jgi:hypothetical protein
VALLWRAVAGPDESWADVWRSALRALHPWRFFAVSFLPQFATGKLAARITKGEGDASHEGQLLHRRRQQDKFVIPTGAGNCCSHIQQHPLRSLEFSHLERETGIEPATNGLGSRYSTIELLPHTSTRLF